MVTIGVRMKAISGDNFFDSAKVKKLLTAAKRKSLSKFGAFVRTTARQSIRPAKILNRKEIRKAKKAGQETPSPIYEPSKAGEAPRTRRAGQPIKRILFGYEPDNGGNVVIGFGLTFGGMTGTPGRLERGGTFTTKKGRTVTVAKRPTLLPALAKEKAKASLMFADSL